MDEEYAAAEKLMEGLMESCIYLFGTNKEFMKEMDKMEEKFIVLLMKVVKRVE